MCLSNQKVLNSEYFKIFLAKLIVYTVKMHANVQTYYTKTANGTRAFEQDNTVQYNMLVI